MDLDKLIKDSIKETLKENGYSTSNETREIVNEAYVIQPGKFDLNTQLLSDKTKKSHQELLDNYSKMLNKVSSELDGVDKSSANLNSSTFRSLKFDETYSYNASFLHGLYFQNISDLSSQISVDSLTHMKLSRDFGTFDRWQEDFIACALSSRNGWAVTLYSTQLRRYINTVIDLHSQNVMIGMQPIIVLDC
jgi:Fe-Mn family superoxide dismutase